MAVPYIPVDLNPTTSAATTGNDTMQSAQYAVVYDLISEGEIQGLVDGAASIYLNGTPLTSQSTKSNITPIAVTNGVFTAGSTTVTHAAGGLANTVGRYAILERGANTNSTFAGTSGSSRITTTTAYFANTMAVNNQQFPIINPKIRIDGLGPNGTEYIGTITQFISNTAAVVEPPISTTGSGKTGARDHVSYVTTASATSITIAAAPTLSGRRFQLVPLTSSATSYTSNDSWNFKNVTMNFRAGTREQTPIIYPNIPTASFLSSIEAPFLWTTGWGGTASVLNYNSTFLGLSSPGEVDKLKIGIEFPGGLYKNTGEKQKIRDSFLGVQIKFQYNQNGVTKTAIIVGPPSERVWENGRGNEYVDGFTGFIEARITTPFVHELEFSVEQFKPFSDFTILLARTTPDDDSEVRTNDDTHVFSARIKYIESQIVDKFRYPHSAYAAISFPAEGFSSIPNRSYKARGLKISVPSNYIPREENVDGIARYIGRWDGSFITKYTNNPAWIFYDLATNKRYGLGKYVDSSLIDKFGLYRIARYCDELVSNGKGGLEPRFTCNVYITQAEEAYKLLRDLATTFRGMTYWAQGALMVSQDRPKEPIYTFTQGNVVDGIFNYEYSGRNARFNEVNITWTNPDQFYQQDVLTVTDQTDIIKRGRIVSMDTVAFGCTSESQAYRVALWNMITSQLETEFVSFTSGINASTLLPGDVINIQDHHLNAIQSSGRIKSAASTTNITLDRNVTLPSGSTYVLHVVYDGPGCYLQQSSANVGGVIYYRGDLIPGVANSTAAAQLLDTANSPVAVSFSPEVHVQRKTINNSLPYTGNVITVSSAFSSTPNTESVWAVENITLDNGVEPKKYRVLSIREEPNALYTIVASNYAEEKFEELEARVKIAPPAYIGPRPGEDVPPVTVMIPQYVRSTMDDLGQEVDSSYFALISWTPPNETYTDSTGTSRTRSYPYISTYEVRYNFFDIPYTTITEYVTETVSGTRNSLEVYGVRPGTYEVAVRVKNTIGEYSPWYTQNITFEDQGFLSGSSIKGLKPGGAIDSGVIFNSNTFTIIDSYYTYTNPAGTTYTIQPATSAQSAQSFANLRSNSTFYLLWDASNTDDPLKAVEHYSDSDISYPYGAANSYWSEAGAANNGLTTLPGTITVAQFTNKVTGTGTFFASNLSIGNLVKLHDSSNNANAFYAVVASISSNTELYTREIIQKPYTAKQLQTLSFKTNYKDDALLAQITTGAGNTANLTIQYVTSTVNEPQLLVLDTTSSGFRYDGNNALIGPTSITFAVNRQNLLGPTNWYVFDANNNSLSNSVLETRTNTSAIINSTSFGNISNNNFIRVRTDVDTLTSNATIFKIRDGLIGANGAPGANGANGTSGVSAATLTLSKASVTLFAYADGNVDGYADAAGQASLYLGNTNVTESTTWASSATVGLTGTISNTSGSKGQYSVSNLATANNTGALTITASYSGLTYTGVFSVSKAKGGYEIVNTLPSTNLFQGRVVFLTTDNKLYRYTGTAWTTVVNEADIANAAISTAKFAAGIEPVTIANSALALPTTRSTEYINWSSRLYRWNGSAYVAAVSNTELTGTIISSQLANASISIAKFASGIEPVTIANSALALPTTRSTEYINWSNRLYRWNGSAYVAAVSNTEMIGTIISSQLADAAVSTAKFASGIEPVTIANSALALPTTRSTEYINWSSRLYRWNGSAYVAAVSNTELTGTIISSQLADAAVSTAKFASGIEPVTISTAGVLPTTRSTEYINWSGRLYRWNGSAYIAAVSNTEMLGTIINSQIADSAISELKLANNAVAAAKIQTGAITASKLNVGIGGGNLLTDSGFESFANTYGVNGVSLNNSNSWFITTGGVGDATRNLFGNVALKAPGLIGANSINVSSTNATVPSSDVILIQAQVPAAPNTKYIASAYVYTNVAGKVFVVARAYNSARDYLEQTISAFAPANQWTRLSTAAITTFANTTNMDVHIRGITANNEYFIVDGAQLEQGDVLTAYAPRPDEILPGTIGTTQIANDAITSDKIIANAITSNKIAVNSLEGDRIKANTLDAAKIVANSITSDQLAANSITASELAANSVVAVKIQAGAITSEKITAGAITTNKLYVVPMGSNLVPDSFFTDATAWNDAFTGVLVTGITDANVGSTAIRNADNLSNEIRSTNFIEVNRDKKYRYEVWAKQLAGTAGVGYLGLAWYSASKTLLDSYIAQPSGAGNPAGWGNGTYSYFGITGGSFPANWTRYSIQFGAGEAAAIPSNARYMKPVFLLNYQANTGVQHAVTGVRIEEKSDAELIVDGSITTNKITVGSLNGDRISANTLDASKIVANSITANQIAASAISADEIAAGAINADKIAAGAVTTSKLTVGDFSVLNKNWNFEEGDISWTKESGWTINNEPANAKSGNWVANCTLTSPTAIKSTTLVPTSSGEVFYGEAYIKFAAGSTGTGGYVRLVGLDSGGGAIWVPAGNLIAPTTTSYTLATVTATVPANVTTVYLDIVSQITAGKTFVDEIRMFRVSTSTLIADGAITTNKITVNSLNGDRISANTLDAAKIVANSITANQIAAAAISADEIAAGAIRTDKLLVSGKGSALNADPAMQDTSAWVFGGHGVIAVQQTVSDGKTGNKVYRSSGNSASSIDTLEYVPVSSGKTYRLSAWVRRSAVSDGVFYIRLVDQIGTQITLTLEAFTPTTTWTNYETTFTPTTSQTSVKLRAILSWANSTTNGYHEITDFRLEEILPGTLIKDGAITTDKITVNSLNGDRISAGTLDAAKIVANSITAGQIQAGAIGADEIAAGAITTGKLLVMNPGASLHPDATFEDQSSWAVTYGGTLASFKTVTDAPAGRYVAFCPNGGSARSIQWHPISSGLGAIPIDRTRNYRFSFYYRTVGGASGSYSYATLQERDSTGALIGTNGGHNFYVWSIAATNQPSWTKVEAIVGPAGTNFSANTRFVCPSFLLNWESAGAEIQISNVRLEPLASGTLIEDGAITTNKITVNSLNGDRITAGTLDASKIVADSITAGQIQAGAIGASEIAAGAITTAKLAVADFSVLNKNWNFEEGDISWTKEGNWSITIEPANAKSGSWVANNTSTTPAALRNNMFVPTSSGEVFYAEAYIKHAAGTTGTGSYVRLRGLNSSSAEVWNPAGSVVGSGTTSYVLSSIKAVVPSDVVTVNVEVVSNITAGKVFADEVRMFRVANTVLIADGAVKAAQIDALAVTTDKLDVGAVTAGKMNVTFLSAISGNVGTLNAGTINLSNMNITGTSNTALNIKSAASGERMEIGSSVIKIFDSAGTLRVKIGNLSL